MTVRGPEGHNGAQGDIPQRIWDDVLKGLTELEAEVVRLRFGLGGKPPLSLTQIATSLKLGRERVRKIETKALSKLEKILPQSTPLRPRQPG